jgi:hypothetical protein
VDEAIDLIGGHKWLTDKRFRSAIRPSILAPGR